MKKINTYKIIKETSNIIAKTISSSNAAAEYAKQFFCEDIDVYESFFIILLSRNNNTIGYVKISQGGVFSTVVDVKLVLKYAIDSLANSVILVHNHPSGNLNPSNEDKNITQRIKKGLEIFDCKLFDHIILTSTGYYSLADNLEI